MKLDKQQEDIYKKWQELVNMSPSELEKFMDSEDGQEAGLTREEAKAEGIHRGRDSARAILRMKGKGVENWTDEDWAWAGRQNSFNSRMLGMKGPLFDEKGHRTRKHTSLLIWGHDPTKKKTLRESRFEELAEKILNS